jgi:hypothetical protein
VELLRDGSEKGRVSAALSNLTGRNVDITAVVFGRRALSPRLVELLKGGSAEGKVKAAGALNYLACSVVVVAGVVDDAINVAITEAGAIVPLVQLLRDGSEKGRINAAGALSNLMGGDAANKESIAEAGAIPLLVELLRSGAQNCSECSGCSECSDMGRTYAAGALAS